MTVKDSQLISNQVINFPSLSGHLSYNLSACHWRGIAEHLARYTTPWNKYLGKEM